MTVVVLPLLAAVGCAAVWRSGRRLDGTDALVAAGTVSVAFTGAVALLLGLLGAFQWWSLGLAALAATGALLMRRREEQSAPVLRPPSAADVRALGVLLSVFVLLLVVTPRWNFQIASGMDAGNYEAYANHYEETGRFHYDVAEAAAPDVPEQWLPGGTSWNASIDRPYYFPAFPALLGAAREALGGDPTSSSLVVMAIALLNAVLLYRIARRSSASPLVAAATTGLAITTVLYFVYSKQIMSEQLALTGMLGFVLGLQLEEDDEGAGVAVLLATAGAGTLVLSKLDGIANIALVVAGLWGAARLGIGLRRAPSVRLAGWVAAALVGTAALTTWLAMPDYVVHTSTARIVPALAALPFADFPLLVPMAVVTGGLLLHLAHTRADTSPDRSWQRAARLALLGAWVLFMLWNATLRPVGQPVENHDARNLLRLVGATSPLLLGLVAVGAASYHRLPRLARALGVGFMTAFAWSVYSSQHSAPDLWWMRRYLVVLVPLLVLAGVGAARFLEERRWPNGAVAAVVAVAAIAQLVRLAPFLVYEQNSTLPGRLAAVEELVGPDAGVVVVEGDKIVRGFGITLASRRDALTLHNVATEELGAAIELVDGPGPEFVIAPAELTVDAQQALGLVPVESGTIGAQWSNWYDDVVRDPDRTRSTRYWLYAHPPTQTSEP